MPGKTFRMIRNPAVFPISFNEAPAKCRGKPGSITTRRGLMVGFNEAPAKCRGKRLDDEFDVQTYVMLQ